MKVNFFKIISLLAFSTFIFNFSSYSFEIGDKNISITFTETYASRYIWRGQDLFFQNDGAYQPSIDITLSNFLKDTDISFGVWGSFPLSNGHQNAEEIDYTFSLNREFDNFSLSFISTYYDFPNLNGKSDIFEPGLNLEIKKVSFIPFSPSFSFFAGYNFKVESAGPREGWYWSFAFKKDIPLKNLKKTISFEVKNWGEDGVAGLEPNFIYATEFSLSTLFSLGKIEISPRFYYTLNYRDAINNGNDEVWGLISFTYSF